MSPSEREYVIEPLGKEHDRSAFKCGVDILDRYLRELAGQDEKRHVAKAYILRHVETGDVAGFYTLANSAIDVAALPAEQLKKAPRYPQLPATLLGRLAVSQAHQNKGFGRLLLMDAMRRALELSRLSASFALIVDAKDESAKAFYQRYDFQSFAGFTNRLFIPMKVIEQILGT